MHGRAVHNVAANLSPHNLMRRSVALPIERSALMLMDASHLLAALSYEVMAAPMRPISQKDAKNFQKMSPERD
jgi:hypothetical protein